MSELHREILTKLGEAAHRLARRSIRSATLRNALQFEHTGTETGRLYIPHYWAIYQHDGRGRVSPVTKRWLVYYRDPADDPRLRGGYPVDLRDVRRLTAEQFKAGLAENQQRFKANPAGGRQQFMVVRPAVGPTAASASYPFFEDGMSTFPAEAREIIDTVIQGELRSLATRSSDSARLRM